MSGRVALTATLAMFLILSGILMLFCSDSVSASNDALTASLQNDLNFLYRVVDSLEEEEITAILAGSAMSDHGIWYGDAEGREIFSTSSLRGDDLSGVTAISKEKIVKTTVQYDENGDSMIYAVRTLPNGGYIVLAKYAVTFGDALQDNTMRYLDIILVACVVVFAVVLFAVSRRQRTIGDIIQVLTSITEGEFETRMTTGPSKEERAEINYILGRMNERIFRQRTRNQALSSVMNLMQHGIIAVDDNLNVILVTPAAKKLLGIKGKPEGMHVNAASQDVKLGEVFLQAMSQGNVYTNEVAARTTEGRGHRPLRLYVSPMAQDGKTVGALAMVEDITELRRLEQVRTDFAANVSHELKTPLTSIRGFVETLMDGALERPEMARKFLKIIMLETERLTRLINDILSISKLESGSDDVPVERIRLDKAAFDVADMLRFHAQEKEVTVHAHENEQPVYIVGNTDRVEQMLINLIENAIKYNRPGGSVTVQVFASGDKANFTVSDTGIGIAEEHLPRMFERFYRVDKGRSRAMGGTGLGLAIVKHIIRTMGGEIEVHSKLGEGTEFLITLPLAAASDAPESGIADGEDGEE